MQEIEFLLHPLIQICHISLAIMRWKVGNHSEKRETEASTVGGRFMLQAQPEEPQFVNSTTLVSLPIMNKS